MLAEKTVSENNNNNNTGSGKDSKTLKNGEDIKQENIESKNNFFNLDEIDFLYDYKAYEEKSVNEFKEMK